MGHQVIVSGARISKAAFEYPAFFGLVPDWGPTGRNPGNPSIRSIESGKWIVNIDFNSLPVGTVD